MKFKKKNYGFLAINLSIGTFGNQLSSGPLSHDIPLFLSKFALT